MLCPQRCSTRARRKVTPNLECFENEEGESGEGNLYCHNCQGQLMHFSTGTLGWTYYWLPHSYKHSHDQIFPLSCSMAEKHQMSQETMDFKDEATWKHFLWSPICCNCIIEEFMLDQDFGFQSVQSVQSVQEQIPLKTPPVQIPRVMQRIIREAECQADSDEFARGRYQTVP